MKSDNAKRPEGTFAGEINGEFLEDQKIKYAIALLDDHLKNHPDRELNSIAYRIEQAINLLKEAQEICIKRYE